VLRTLALASAILVALPLQAQERQLDVVQVDADNFRLTAVVPGTDAAESVQQALGPVAAQLCGSRPPILGKYRFESVEQLDGPDKAPPTIRMVQDVSCGAPTPASIAALGVVRPAPADWREDAATEAAARKAFTAFHAARDRGDYEAAYAMMSPGMRHGVTLAGWRDSDRSWRKGAGKLRGRELRKVTWYPNPAASPKPGVYVAMDYASRFEKLDIQCGYVVLYQTGDASFEVMREESGFLDRASAAKMTPAEREELLRKLRCAPASATAG
jgi:hypothetical protein